MKKNIDISLVILNFNSSDYIRDCLDSIKKSDLSGINTETIVVDNASTDNSVTLLRRNYPEIKLITSKINKGFAGGNNLARGKTKGKYLLFLNPDTKVNKHTLKTVFEFMEANSDVGAATCASITATGQFDYAGHRGFPTPLNAFFYFSGLSRRFPGNKFLTGYTQGWKIKDSNPHEVEVISGAFFFVRSKLADEIGWWDEDYFFYGEDIEFSWRIKEKGWKIMYLPNAKMIHYGGVTSGIRAHTKKISQASRETKIRSVKASTNAMELFYKKHYLERNPRIVSSITLLGIKMLEKYRVYRV